MNASYKLHFSGHRFWRVLAVVVGLSSISSARADITRDLVSTGDCARVTVKWDFAGAVPDSSLLVKETLPAGADIVLLGEVGAGQTVEATRQNGSVVSFLIAREALANTNASFTYEISGAAAESITGLARSMNKDGTATTWAITTNLSSSGNGDGGSSDTGIVVGPLTIRAFSLAERAGKTVACFQWTGSGDKDVLIQRASSLDSGSSSVQALGAEWETVAVVKASSVKALASAGDEEDIHSYELETTASQGFFRLQVVDNTEAK